VRRNHKPLWRIQAREDGRLHQSWRQCKQGSAAQASQADAKTAWHAIAAALVVSRPMRDRLRIQPRAQLAEGNPETCQRRERSRFQADPLGALESSTSSVSNAAPSDPLRQGSLRQEPAICCRPWLTAYRRVNIITAILEAHVIE